MPALVRLVVTWLTVCALLVVQFGAAKATSGPIFWPRGHVQRHHSGQPNDCRGSVLSPANRASEDCVGINGDLDLGKVLENALAAGLSAGLVTGVNLELFGTSTNPLMPGSGTTTLANADPLLPGGTLTSVLGPGGGGFAAVMANPAIIGNSLVQAGVDAVIQAGVTSLITGTDFGDALVAALRRDLAMDVVSPGLMNLAGDIGDDNGYAAGSVEEVLLHAGAGAISGFITGGAKGAAGGALGAALGELALGVDPSLQDPANAQFAAGLSQIIGGLGSLMVGDASMSGADAALAGYLYNALSHPNDPMNANTSDAEKRLAAALDKARQMGLCPNGVCPQRL